MSLGSHETTHSKEGVEDTSTIVTPQWSFMRLFMWLKNEGDTILAIEIGSSLSDDLSCTIFRKQCWQKRLDNTASTGFLSSSIGCRLKYLSFQSACCHLRLVKEILCRTWLLAELHMNSTGSPVPGRHSMKLCFLSVLLIFLKAICNCSFMCKYCLHI
jgi:hypothetical protein